MLLLLVALAQPSVPSAPGDGAPVLQWTAPEGCPSPANVQARIEAYLGELPPPGSGSIEATVEPDGRGFQLTVAVTSPSGTTSHTLRSDSCETLADAVALVAAVALDPMEAATAVEARAPPPKPEPPPDEPPPPDPPPPPPDEPPPPRDPKATSDASPQPRDDDIRQFPRLRMGLRPEFVVDWGALPRVTIGGAFSGVMMGQHWRVEVTPTFVAARSAASSRVPQATALVNLTAVGVRGCGVPRSRNRVVEGALCGGIELGGMGGRGTGRTQQPRERIQLWSAGLISPGVAFVPRYWLSVFAGVDVVVPFERVAFELGDETVHRASSVGMRGRIGLEVRVP